MKMKNPCILLLQSACDDGSAYLQTAAADGESNAEDDTMNSQLDYFDSSGQRTGDGIIGNNHIEWQQYHDSAPLICDFLLVPESPAVQHQSLESKHDPDNSPTSPSAIYKKEALPLRESPQLQNLSLNPCGMNNVLLLMDLPSASSQEFLLSITACHFDVGVFDSAASNRITRHPKNLSEMLVLPVHPAPSTFSFSFQPQSNTSRASDHLFYYVDNMATTAHENDAIRPTEGSSSIARVSVAFDLREAYQIFRDHQTHQDDDRVLLESVAAGRGDEVKNTEDYLRANTTAAPETSTESNSKKKKTKLDGQDAKSPPTMSHHQSHQEALLLRELQVMVRKEEQLVNSLLQLLSGLGSVLVISFLWLLHRVWRKLKMDPYCYTIRTTLQLRNRRPASSTQTSTSTNVCGSNNCGCVVDFDEPPLHCYDTAAQNGFRRETNPAVSDVPGGTDQSRLTGKDGCHVLEQQSTSAVRSKLSTYIARSEKKQNAIHNLRFLHRVPSQPVSVDRKTETIMLDGVAGKKVFPYAIAGGEKEDRPPHHEHNTEEATAASKLKFVSSTRKPSFHQQLTTARLRKEWQFGSESPQNLCQNERGPRDTATLTAALIIDPSSAALKQEPASAHESSASEALHTSELSLLGLKSSMKAGSRNRNAWTPETATKNYELSPCSKLAKQWEETKELRRKNDKRNSQWMPSIQVPEPPQLSLDLGETCMGPTVTVANSGPRYTVSTSMSTASQLQLAGPPPSVVQESSTCTTEQDKEEYKKGQKHLYISPFISAVDSSYSNKNLAPSPASTTTSSDDSFLEDYWQRYSTNLQGIPHFYQQDQGNVPWR